MEDQDDQTCLLAGISLSFQKHYSLLCQLGFSNHDAAEHLVLFCVQCSCHRSVIEKWNQVHSSRPVIINAMQSLLYWLFSECYSCFNGSFYQIKAPTKQSSLPSVLGNRDNALGKLYSDYLYWHDPEPHYRSLPSCPKRLSIQVLGGPGVAPSSLVHRGTQRGYRSKPLNIALLNVF